MTIILDRYRDATTFRNKVLDFLSQTLAAHNQLYSIVRTMDAQSVLDRDSWLIGLKQAGRTCGVALIHSLPPHRDLLVTTLSVEAIEALVAAMIHDRLKPTALIGPVATVRAIVFGLGYHGAVRFHVGTHVLDAPPQLMHAEGLSRMGTERDLDLLEHWTQAFIAECRLPAATPELRKTIKERLQSADQHYWFWEVANRPVGMALARAIPPVGRIGMVYTAPDSRRRGYAAALVGELCTRLQASDCEQVFLDTDLANPDSNKVYKKIGFRQTGEMLHLDLV